MLLSGLLSRPQRPIYQLYLPDHLPACLFSWFLGNETILFIFEIFGVFREVPKQYAHPYSLINVNKFFSTTLKSQFFCFWQPKNITPYKQKPNVYILLVKRFRRLRFRFFFLQTNQFKKKTDWFISKINRHK